MTDKYYRLVTILVNICPGPLRKLFKKLAKTDPNANVPYTTLDAYLSSRQKDIMRLKTKKVLRQHQYDLLFPPSPGQTDINTWDLTLLALMLTDLFNQVLKSSKELKYIIAIRDIRNDLQHISGTCQITNSDFLYKYKRLSSKTIKLAKSAKGQAYSDEIEAKIKNVEASVLIDLGDVLRQWYVAETSELKENIQDLKDEVVQLKNVIQDIKEDTTQTKQTVKKVTVKRARRDGKMSKRLKTENPNLDTMRGNFLALMRQEKNTDFQSPSESARIQNELDENHLVVVSGYGKCLYQQTALSVIESLGYTEGRCVAVSFPSDWRHFGPEDVDLAVFLYPFGKDKFDEDTAKLMKGNFDSIKDSTVLSTSEDDTIDVMIITDQSILDECKTHFTHDIIENPVIVYKPTTEDSPVELVESKNPVCSVSTDPHYRNLLVQSIAYCKHHRMQLVDRSILEEAQELFRMKKVIVISGPRGSGKTTLALSLLSSYQEGHYLILTEPSDLKEIRFGETCVVVIEDLGGKYSIELPVIQQWLRKFDMLYSAIKEGKLNVIITCDMERLNAFMIDASKHPILNSVVPLKKSGIVKVKQEPSTEGYPGSSFLSSDKNQPMTLFSVVKKIKHVNLPPNNKIGRWHDFFQYIDGSYMRVTEDTAEDEMTEIIRIDHFSSDFQHIRQYQTDIDACVYAYPCICCTGTGELVLARDYQIHLCRITDGTFQLVKSAQLSRLCLSLSFSMNRISCLLDDTSDIIMLDRNLNKKQTVTLNRREFDYYDTFTFVPISNKTFFYCNDYNNDIVFEDTKQKQLKYLREEGFVPLCACAAGEDSVFVLGRQDRENSRILQVNKDVEILTDILIGKEELQVDVYERRTKIEFDASNSRLVVLKREIPFLSLDLKSKISEIYLK